ncbi:MAG TPA: OmpW family outer membrane protein [Candidatus Fermentibacter daniensis]|nr:OmpW family outer membrane protein [Candidatus Fermentibacter daniensis]HPH40154.1 OmpW family outer membrane protein [Candidatus Fermentibacter daniensis]
MRTMLILFLASAAVWGGEGDWTVSPRVCIDGIDTYTGAEDMKFFSAVYFAASVSRALSPLFGVEFSAACATHEAAEGDGEDSMGSVKFLPVTLSLQCRPLPRGRFDVYIGAGGGAVLFRETSGNLDSLDLPACVTPTAQLGVDWNLTPNLVLELGARWLWLNTGLEDDGFRLMDLSMDVMELSLGVGARL